MKTLLIALMVVGLLAGSVTAGTNLWSEPANFKVQCGEDLCEVYELVEVNFECSPGETLWSISWYVSWDVPTLVFYEFEEGDFWELQYFYAWTPVGGVKTIEQWDTKSRGATSGTLATFKACCDWAPGNPPTCRDGYDTDLDFGIIWAHNADHEDITATVTDNWCECPAR